MPPKTSLKMPGVVRVRLAYLRRRKTLLDELLDSLERYTFKEVRAGETHEKAKEIAQQRAGAA
jgi:hypothetical protein